MNNSAETEEPVSRVLRPMSTLLARLRQEERRAEKVRMGRRREKRQFASIASCFPRTLKHQCRYETQLRNEGVVYSREGKTGHYSNSILIERKAQYVSSEFPSAGQDRQQCSLK
jgi:hypothetical protein